MCIKPKTTTNMKRREYKYLVIYISKEEVVTTSNLGS